tara:strand:+ start:620 stop:1141 length:522 start_codon:yes stop_codon:yes gene_type:complete
MRYDNTENMKYKDLADGRHFSSISSIANMRMNVLADEFRSRFPKRSLKIVFGNGSQCCSVDGTRFTVWGEKDWMLQGLEGSFDLDSENHADILGFIAEAISDVWDITEHYERGCPNDLEVLPDDSELGGTSEDQERTDRIVGEDIPDDGVSIPGYNREGPGSPSDPVHVQRAR